MPTQVLIVGAGPTGLTLAIDLGLRGVRCMLVEQKDEPAFLPKMERCNARTMEIYRRMGIAERVRAAGLPAHCPMDIFIVFSLTEPPLVHHPHPSVDRGEGADRQVHGRHAAARALSADLAVHARTAAEADRRDAAERHGAVRLRAAVVQAGSRGVTATRARPRRRDVRDRRRNISSAATAARARCASSSASRCRATSCCSSARRCSVATSCTSASRSARGGTITSPTTRRRSSSCRIRPGISPCTRSSRAKPRCGRCSRRPSRCRSPTRCCSPACGGRTCCSPTGTARAVCSSPAMRCIW